MTEAVGVPGTEQMGWFQVPTRPSWGHTPPAARSLLPSPLQLVVALHPALGGNPSVSACPQNPSPHAPCHRELHWPGVPEGRVISVSIPGSEVAEGLTFQTLEPGAQVRPALSSTGLGSRARSRLRRSSTALLPKGQIMIEFTTRGRPALDRRRALRTVPGM